MPKKEYRSFEDARDFVRRLGLKGLVDWRYYCKSGQKPNDIPAAANRIYKDQGWVSWGDWLGKGEKDSRKRKWRSFEDALDYVQGLGLKNQKEWWAYSKSGKKPYDIPASPHTYYRGLGWISFGHWLGTGAVYQSKREFRPFEEARDYARSLGIKKQCDWTEYAKSGKLPDDIPMYPAWHYKDKGWSGWGDWLGTYNIAFFRRQYRSFADAREFARQLRLKNYKEWRKFCKSGQLPKDIPADPRHQYKDKGWISFGDWLDNGTLPRNTRQYKPFEEARDYVWSLGIKNSKQWLDYSKSGQLPQDIPANPSYHYKDKGWESWRDWLGQKLSP